MPSEIDFNTILFKAMRKSLVDGLNESVKRKRIIPSNNLSTPQEDPMMKFVVYSDEAKTTIQLEQSADDVVVRAGGMGVATFQALDATLRVSKQGLLERGITLVVEELPLLAG